MMMKGDDEYDFDEEGDYGHNNDHNHQPNSCQLKDSMLDMHIHATLAELTDILMEFSSRTSLFTHNYHNYQSA